VFWSMASVAMITVVVTLFFVLSVTTLIVLCAKAKERRNSTARAFRAVHYDVSNIPTFSYVPVKTKRNELA
jgi:hypothetical protein